MSNADIDRALRAAESAFQAYGRGGAGLHAAFLDAMAGALASAGPELAALAHSETALGIPRLTNECVRTVNQLRLFATVVREGSWVDACIDTADLERTPPKPDVRRLNRPLGPIGIFAASNFPLAFSVAGGDTASALAAGNPVLVKAHPAHPRTSDRVAELVLGAGRGLGLPEGTFSLVHGATPEVGMALVRHPLTRAIGFTGSLRGGRALFDAAASRPEPIAVYAEMGSTNPVFVLPEALRERGRAIATTLADSATLGAGQFCTKPGIVFAVESDAYDAFAQTFARRIAEKPAVQMLYPDLAARFADSTGALARSADVSQLAQGAQPSDANTGANARPVAWEVRLSTFLVNALLREEMFGPSTILVRAAAEDDLVRAVQVLEGQLTATVYGTASDLARATLLLEAIQRKVGRLIFNGAPTGVEVCAAMNHGGPYPATTDVRTTSVGTAAIARFARPLCYQDAPASILPAELLDHNPRGIWRTINGRLTRDPVSGGT